MPPILESYTWILKVGKDTLQIYFTLGQGKTYFIVLKLTEPYHSIKCATLLLNYLKSMYFYLIVIIHLLCCSNWSTGFYMRVTLVSNWLRSSTAKLKCRVIRVGTRAHVTSNMKLFLIIVKGWKALAIIAKSSILDVAGVVAHVWAIC